MESTNISILANVVIAISTIFGVSGTIAYYLKQIAEFKTSEILLSLTFYILLTLLITLLTYNLLLKWQNQKTGGKETNQ